MSELYLIAHKVRGEPAFDVATQMECPECTGHDALYRAMYGHNCVECDGLGFWWIIPTSGHRAYPYDHQPLLECIELADWAEMPEGIADHYTTRAAPRIDLAAALGIAPRSAAPMPPLPRRI